MAAADAASAPLRSDARHCERPAEVGNVPEARYVIETTAGVPVVVAPPGIDIGNAAQLRATLLRAVAMGHTTIAVDMSATDFCDSAGLTVLVRARRLALAEGRELRLVVSTPQVIRILSVTGLDRWFPCFRTRAEAASGEVSVTLERPGDVETVPDTCRPGQDQARGRS
jgi:anti-sigma B factor antagonist